MAFDIPWSWVPLTSEGEGLSYWNLGENGRNGRQRYDGTSNWLKRVPLVTGKFLAVQKILILRFHAVEHLKGTRKLYSVVVILVATTQLTPSSLSIFIRAARRELNHLRKTYVCHFLQIWATFDCRGGSPIWVMSTTNRDIQIHRWATKFTGQDVTRW